MQDRRHDRVGPLREEIVIGLDKVAGWPAPVGVHRVLLHISADACASSETLVIKVVTPLGGVMRCRQIIEESTASPKIKRTFIQVLEASIRSINRGQIDQATGWLEQFLLKLDRYRPDQLDPTVAQRWADCVEWAMDGLDNVD